ANMCLNDLERIISLKRTYIKMTHVQPQFQRSLLRMGSVALIAGSIIAIISTIFHASTEDPDNHLVVFTTYACDDSWIAIHIGQFAGVVMVLVEDL
ncbi:MAG TPA: hypothetical protein VFY50_03310, partial [Candidatus Nitrosocosmicus sp.]|nr:hypothetical protein [Candidatus Nitrosocosmicus sp.]